MPGLAGLLEEWAKEPGSKTSCMVLERGPGPVDLIVEWGRGLGIVDLQVSWQLTSIIKISQFKTLIYSIRINSSPFGHVRLTRMLLFSSFVWGACIFLGRV